MMMFLRALASLSKAGIHHLENQGRDRQVE